jgi:hypothetical protein
MKKLIILITLAASTAAAQIIVGTNSFDVVFEATNLTSATQSRIVVDINICRQLWTNSLVCLDDPGTTPYIHDENVIFEPYFNEMTFPNELVTNSTGVLSLFVNKPVSDAYLKAFEFADANSNIVAAAAAFVDTIMYSNIVCNTMEELAEYVIITSNTEIDPSKFFERSEEMEFSKPSAMSFGYMAATLPQAPGISSNLVMKLQYRMPISKSIDQMPCVWHDNKWKLVWGY